MDFYEDKAMSLSRACKDYRDSEFSITIYSFSLCKELPNGLRLALWVSACVGRSLHCGNQLINMLPANYCFIFIIITYAIKIRPEFRPEHYSIMGLLKVKSV